MPANKNTLDPIPENFETDDELDEFWTNHSTADCPENFREVHFNIKFDDQEFVPVTGDLARKLAQRARQRKMSVSELMNQMLEEQLKQTAWYKLKTGQVLETCHVLSVLRGAVKNAHSVGNFCLSNKWSSSTRFQRFQKKNERCHPPNFT